MASALDGIRVIDFGQYVAGPMAGMLLADQGADVIRVDPPGGPRMDTPANATWNRGKRSIVLDLKDRTDLETARRLIRSADVVIENFRPGVMDRLGLGPEAMTQENGRLIYCSIPGFASDDPRAAVPAWEGVVGAATATYMQRPQIGMTDAGTNRFNESPMMGQPVYVTTPISSTYAAFLAVTSIATALIARERDGLGQRIETPMFDSTLLAIGSPRGMGTTTGSPWARQYECADGRWVHINCANTAFAKQFLRVAGVEHWAKEKFIGNLERPTVVVSPEQALELLERMTRLFLTRTAEQWEEAINEGGEGTACCVVRTSAEWLEHPHARESQMIIEVNDPKYGPMLQPGLQVRLSETPGRVRGPAPAPDQNRREILAELATLPPHPPATGRAAASTRPPLDGIRLLDLGIILIGPTTGRTLMEFGADTIKIDDPAGTGPSADVSRGKRSMLLTLKQSGGSDVLWKLVDGADVFLQNFRMGVVDRLGFGYEEVRKRRPDIIYISVNTYGHLGPFAMWPGWEYMAQATTGMELRFGGEGGQPTIQPFPVNDFGTGVAGAYAVALALYHRKRTGQGQHVDTALSYTATTMQSNYLQGYKGKVWDEPRGQNVMGTGPLHRIYRASDGWLFLGASDANLQRLESVAGLGGISKVQKPALAAFLEERLANDSVATWVKKLTAAGAGAHQLMTVAEVMADPWLTEHGLRLTRAHPDGGIVDTLGPTPRLSRTPVRPGAPLRPSMDAPEILSELGLASQLDRLIDSGIIAIRPPVPASAP
ncbi:MAG: CoA transferase [Dehalococcoidia bacterium]|nr:CoA transferase [Dehalococcoidia bacterium]